MPRLAIRVRVNERCWTPQQLSMARLFLRDHSDERLADFLERVDPDYAVDLDAYTLRECLEDHRAWFCPACERWFPARAPKRPMGSVFGYRMVCEDCRFAHGLRLPDGWTLKHRRKGGRHGERRL